MIRYLVAIALALSLVACSTVTKQRPSLLGQIKTTPVRVIPNASVDVTHEQVRQHYQRFLEVSDDSEMRIRTTYRMAALKLQAEELALDDFNQTDQENTTNASSTANTTTD